MLNLIKKTREDIAAFAGRAPLQCPQCETIGASVILYTNYTAKITNWECPCGYQNHIDLI